MNSIETSLRSRSNQFGQEHLFKFWENLNDEEKESLLMDIQQINLEETVRLYESVNKAHVIHEKLDSRMEPVPASLHGSINRAEASTLKEYEHIGLKEIADGHVGVILMAGGQGTRLGFHYPKGMYNVGLPSNKSLFQIQAERIFKLQTLAKEKFSKPCTIPWYIMTSSATSCNTKEFFEKNNYFGLNENSVIMFEQGMLPCFDSENGKILLEEKYKIAKSPDGNGGLYKAVKGKILEDMEKRGVKYLHAYCVDNILVKVADPIFIGYCVKNQAECGAKVVDKVSPNEPIGVFCKVDGKLQVVEYSEISKETAEKQNKDGTLMFNAGNICNHFFTVEFLKNFSNCNEKHMKLHRADKKIPHIDSEGKKVKPETLNGVKIEKFIFDVFPFASKFVIWEVNRDEEFSPLKNSCQHSDKDNPNTAKQAIFNLHRKFISRVGGKVCGDGPFEISPLLSYAGEGLTEFKGRDLKTVYLASPNEKIIPSQNGLHLHL